jgi:chromosome segregation protein
MKRLESIKLVQFLLYESEDFPIDETSGLFGANGSGKSSALDAVQIAMFGASKSAMAFNAQADSGGIKQTRTLRSYCLGQYGDEITESVRTNSTTYITLTWRNLETGEPTCTGICIEASLDSEEPRVLGRYVINGVELAMVDHLQNSAGTITPLPWQSFRSRLLERAKITNEYPLFDDATSYTKQVLFALRGKAGQPSYDAFIRAFRFALRMRFDKPIDHIVRQDVLENRPTNIKKFKAIVDTFKRINVLIEGVEKKIADGKKVATLYLNAQTKLRQAASWQGLATIAQEEEAQFFCEAEQENLEQATDAAQKLKQKSQMLTDSLQGLESEISHLMTRQQTHIAHQENAHAQLDQATARHLLANSTDTFHQELTQLSEALEEAAEFAYLSSFRDQMLTLSARLQLQIATPGLASTEALQLPLLDMNTIGAQIRSKLESERLVLSNQAIDIGDKIEILEASLKRAKQGRASLSRDAQILLNELLDQGLSPIPVCDLVRITDTRWQPAIEAYLSKNTEAVLLPRDQEAQAFDIYRGLTGRRAAYGVKIVRSNQINIISNSQKGLVAELIDGSDPIAVAYLRGQLSNLMRADESGDALQNARTLTMDGMYVSPRDFERLKLDDQNMRIGSGANGQADRLQAELGQCRLEKRQTRDRITAIEKMLDLTGSFTSPVAPKLILSLSSSYQKALRQSELADQRVANIADTEYLSICEKLVTQQSSLLEVKIRAAQATKEAMHAEFSLDQLAKNYQSSELRLQQCVRYKEECRKHEDYDPEWVSVEWGKLIEQFDTAQSMISHCNSQLKNSDDAGRSQAVKARNLLWNYLNDHHESLGENDLEDWRKAKFWIDHQVSKLVNTELPEHKTRAEEAYKASQETFRQDVAIALNTNLEFMRQTFDRLNAALRNTPLFTNGERYQFMYKLRPQLKTLSEFIKNVADFGVNGSLFGETGSIPPEFEELLREKTITGNAAVKSPLDDYREFYEFDVRIEQVDPEGVARKTVDHLSKRLGHGSGGEHRAPLYVIAGAGLWSAYRMDHGMHDGLRLILLDEAFDKMDTSNMVATMKYLQELGLQVLLASPGENLGTLNAFLNSYFEVQKDPVRHAIQVDRVSVTEAMREEFKADLWEFHPELIELEKEVMLSAQLQSQGPLNGASE